MAASQAVDTPQHYGIALTNRNLTDGVAKVRIEFGKTDTEGLISAGLLLDFQSERSRCVLVQLGAHRCPAKLVGYRELFARYGVKLASTKVLGSSERF